MDSGDDNTRNERPRWLAPTVPATTARTGAPAAPFDPKPKRFEEAAELGRGGMGRVFEAHDHALDRTVAIKQSLTDDPGLLARFEREVRIAARLQHPGIVPVLDAGRDAEGRPYFVMRKVEGHPLADRIRDAAGERERLELVPSVLGAVDAIAYAHAQGVIHRDLKPWNVLLGPFGETLVIDWGLARELDDTTTDEPVVTAGLTRAGEAYGTPGFMAPEQARGETSDRSTDVYALGATLYHVLAGKPPFAGTEPTAHIAAVAAGEPIDLALPETIPVELAAIVAKAMAPDRAARYRDGSELAADLRRFLGGQLVAAHRYTTRARIARWLARHRLVVAIAVAAVTVLAIVGTISIRRVIAARDAAREASVLEAIRADEGLLERARALTPIDPTHALAVLKQMPITSPVWHRAREVISAALATGPSWGYPANIDRPVASEITAAPDGHAYAYVTGTEILIGEPSLREAPHRIATTAARPVALEWLDRDTIIADVTHGLVRIDATTGAQTPLDAGGKVEKMFVAHGQIYAIAAHHLREIDPDGGKPSVERGEAKAANVFRVGDGLVYDDGHSIVYRTDGPVVITPDTGVIMVVGSVSGAVRVALTLKDEVREFELGPTGFTLRGTWSVRGTADIAYADERLVATQFDQLAWLEPGKLPAWQGQPVKHNELVEISMVPLWWGMLLATYDRFVFASQNRPPIELAVHGDPLESFTLVGDYIVGATARGELRSWRIGEAMPHLLGVDADASMLVVGDRDAWFGNVEVHGEPSFVDLDYKSRVLHGLGVGPSSAVVCEASDRVVIGVDAEMHLSQQTATPMRVVEAPPEFKNHLLSKTTLLWGCSETAGAFAEASATELTVRDLADIDTVAATFPLAAKPTGIVEARGWIAVLDEHWTMHRIDVAHRRTDTIQLDENMGAFAIDSEGVLAVERGPALALWSVGQTQPIIVPNIATQFVQANPLGFVVFTKTKEIVVVTPAGQISGRYAVGADDVHWIPPRSTTMFTRSTDGRLATLDLRDGSVATYPWRADEIKSTEDGGTAILRRSNSAELLLMRRLVPDNAFVMRGLLDAVTNATIEPGSTTLTWR